MIAHNPFHGSGQAGFRHPALALGDDAHAAQGIGMTDGRRRQPASDKAPHAVPEPSHVDPKDAQRVVVHGRSVVPDVSAYHGIPEIRTYAAEYPARTFPLSTLRRRSCERLRMTRGRCGPLIHFRMTFRFATPRRFNRRTGEDS